MIKHVEHLLNVELPSPGLWEVRRIDVAEVFRFSDSKAIKHEIKQLETKVRRLEEQLDKFDDKYLSGKLNDSDFQRLTRKLMIQLEELGNIIREKEKELARLELGTNINANSIIEGLENFDKLFDLADAQEKKELIRALVKSVHVKSNRKEIDKINF